MQCTKLSLRNRELRSFKSNIATSLQWCGYLEFER